MLLMAHACRLSFFVSYKNCFCKIIQLETNVNGPTTEKNSRVETEIELKYQTNECSVNSKATNANESLRPHPIKPI